MTELAKKYQMIAAIHFGYFDSFLLYLDPVFQYVEFHKRGCYFSFWTSFTRINKNYGILLIAHSNVL